MMFSSRGRVNLRLDILVNCSFVRVSGKKVFLSQVTACVHGGLKYKPVLLLSVIFNLVCNLSPYDSQKSRNTTTTNIVPYPSWQLVTVYKTCDMTKTPK